MLRRGSLSGEAERLLQRTSLQGNFSTISSSDSPGLNLAPAFESKNIKRRMSVQLLTDTRGRTGKSRAPGRRLDERNVFPVLCSDVDWLELQRCVHPRT